MERSFTAVFESVVNYNDAKIDNFIKPDTFIAVLESIEE